MERDFEFEKQDYLITFDFEPPDEIEVERIDVYLPSGEIGASLHEGDDLYERIADAFTSDAEMQRSALDEYTEWEIAACDAAADRAYDEYRDRNDEEGRRYANDF